MLGGFNRSDQIRNPDVVNDAFEDVLPAVVPINLYWQRRCGIALLDFREHRATSQICKRIQGHITREIDLVFRDDDDISFFKDVGGFNRRFCMQRRTLLPTSGNRKLKLSVRAGQNRRAPQTLELFASDRDADQQRNR